MTLKHNEDSSHFISLSDIMTTLMLVFLFISVSFILEIQKKYADHGRCERITKDYFDKKEELYTRLHKEFKNDLQKWGADINTDLSITFNETTLQFDKNEAALKEEFQVTLKEFFPRYIKVIQEYKKYIHEIRIEGHTDSTGPCNINSTKDCVMKDGPYAVNGNNYTNEQKNYLYNMGLSQARARNVLAYCLSINDEFAYMKQYVTANGLSYSKLKYTSGFENKAASRRVEFKVLLKAEDQLKTIVIK